MVSKGSKGSKKVLREFYSDVTSYASGLLDGVEIAEENGVSVNIGGYLGRGLMLTFSSCILVSGYYHILLGLRWLIGGTESFRWVSS